MAKGGAREGAGRKRKTEDRLDIKVYCRLIDKEMSLLKEKAKNSNISVSQYIRNAVLKNMDNDKEIKIIEGEDVR